MKWCPTNFESTVANNHVECIASLNLYDVKSNTCQQILGSAFFLIWTNQRNTCCSSRYGQTCTSSKSGVPSNRVSNHQQDCGQLFASCLKDTFATRTKRAKSHHKLKGHLTALNKHQPGQLEFICTKNSAENVQSNRNLLNYQKCIVSKYAEKLKN